MKNSATNGTQVGSVFNRCASVAPVRISCVWRISWFPARSARYPPSRQNSEAVLLKHMRLNRRITRFRGCKQVIEIDLVRDPCRICTRAGLRVRRGLRVCPFCRRAFPHRPQEFSTVPKHPQTFPRSSQTIPSDSQMVPKIALNAFAVKQMPFSPRIIRRA
jgi:hypothetical protein